MDIFSGTLIAGASSLITSVGTLLANRALRAKEKTDHDDRLEIHRDDLTFTIIQAAREELAGARLEMGNLREETKKLRALEQHFQQALDHLDAILYSNTPAERAAAERAGRAFVKRMRRLIDARGTITNEVQRAESGVRLAGNQIDPLTKGDKP